jgi:hypothetical protein
MKFSLCDIPEDMKHFRNKKRDYLKELMELAMNSKNKNIKDLHRGMN